MDKIILNGFQILEIAEEVRRLCVRREFFPLSCFSVNVVLIDRGGRIEIVLFGPEENQVRYFK